MAEINNIPPTTEVDSNVEKDASIGTDNMNQLANETTDHKCESGCCESPGCEAPKRGWSTPQDIILEFNEYYLRKAEVDNYPFLPQSAEFPQCEDENARIQAVFNSNYESLAERYANRKQLAEEYNDLLFRFYEYCCGVNYSLDFNTFLCMWNYSCELTGDLVSRIVNTIDMYKSFNRTLMR